MPLSIEHAILSSALTSITEEMRSALKFSAYSPIIREMDDQCSGLHDHRGRLIATSTQTIPGLLGAVDTAIDAVLADYGDAMQPGDVFILNDPYGGGGSHLPDVTLVEPVFVDDRLLGFAASVAHHSDLGGPYPGGESVHSRSILHEGLRLPVMRWSSRGVDDPELPKLIRSNVRDPLSTIGDLRAQQAACRKGVQRLLGLVDKYGEESVRAGIQAIMDYSEERTRTSVAQLPDGHTHFVDHFEGLTESEPVRVEIDVTVHGSEIVIDFTGTDPQVAGPFNLTYNATRNCCLVASMMFSDSGAPTNDGSFRHLTVRAPEGSVVNAQYPAGLGMRQFYQYRLADMVLHAFSEIFPDASHGGAFAGFASVTASAFESGDQSTKVMSDVVVGGMGAGRNSDGANAVDVLVGNLAMLSAEVCETTFPVRMRRSELVRDSGGPGQHRGGLGLRREYEILDVDQTVNLATEQSSPDSAPWGHNGGLVGGLPRLERERATGEAESFGCVEIESRPGDVLRVVSGGGGGWGDPRLRSRDLLARDVAHGYVSPSAAVEIYGGNGAETESIG